MVLALPSTTPPTHTTADMEHEQCYKSAITITEPPGQHTEYTRRGELRLPCVARDAVRGSACSSAMNGSVLLRLGRVGRRGQPEQQSARARRTRTPSVVGWGDQARRWCARACASSSQTTCTISAPSASRGSRPLVDVADHWRQRSPQRPDLRYISSPRIFRAIGRDLDRPLHSAHSRACRNS